MIKYFNLLMPALCIFLWACSGHGNLCNDPVPLQPTFTKDKTQVNVGGTVTFNYNGPAQAANVSFRWIFDGGNPNYSSNRTSVAVVYNTPGSYSVRLEVSNCNKDQPQITVTPCVIVVP